MDSGGDRFTALGLLLAVDDGIAADDQVAGTGQLAQHGGSVLVAGGFTKDLLVADDDGIAADNPAGADVRAPGNVARLVQTQADNQVIRSFIGQGDFFNVARHHTELQADLFQQFFAPR